MKATAASPSARATTEVSNVETQKESPAELLARLLAHGGMDEEKGYSYDVWGYRGIVKLFQEYGYTEEQAQDAMFEGVGVDAYMKDQLRSYLQPEQITHYYLRKVLQQLRWTPLF